MTTKGEKSRDEKQLAVELLPLYIDCVNGCKLFMQTIVPFDASISIYRAAELQKALSTLIERCLKEGVKDRMT